MLKLIHLPKIVTSNLIKLQYMAAPICLRKYVFNNQTQTRNSIKTLTRNMSNIPKPEQKEDKGQFQRSIPRLMNFPEIIWPSVLKTIKNWILIQFIIRPYFDNSFQIKDFVFGAKRAVEVVSLKIANADFGALANILSSDVIAELKPTLHKLSLAQRNQLLIRTDDIYLSFPYQIGIMFDEKNYKVQKRWVEITMVFHVLQGLNDIEEPIPWNIGTLPEYQEKVFVCNYRFVKEFTSGQESDWTINVVNHFKPMDIIREK